MLPPGSIASWPMQASYAAKGDWVGLMKRNQKGASKSQAAKAAPAAAAPAPDDLTQISGIGPRLASILARGGVSTYAQLEQMSPDELREIIALGGALPPSSLSSWPAQASYAARGDWQGLATYNRSR
jgi:predicted flap endonuclease-1-like 5' DNA nuclease